MTLLELIAKLQAKHAELGDLPVLAEDSEHGYYGVIDALTFQGYASDESSEYSTVVLLVGKKTEENP